MGETKAPRRSDLCPCAPREARCGLGVVGGCAAGGAGMGNFLPKNIRGGRMRETLRHDQAAPASAGGGASSCHEDVIHRQKADVCKVLRKWFAGVGLMLGLGASLAGNSMLELSRLALSHTCRRFPLPLLLLCMRVHHLRCTRVGILLTLPKGKSQP